jgi:excisionase family DNA binding protein
VTEFALGSVPVRVDREVLEALAERVAAILAARVAMPARRSPYVSVDEAAEYLRCARQRVYDLCSAGRLTRYKDGARVLISIDELDAYLRGEATGTLVALALPQPSRNRMARTNAS